MTFALSQAAALTVFCAIGALCGVSAAFFSFDRSTKRRIALGVLIDFFAIAAPSTLFFVALHGVCGGQLRAAHLVFAATAAVAAYRLSKRPLCALRRNIYKAVVCSAAFKILKRAVTK